MEAVEETKACTTCKHHQGKQSLDDVPDECFPCVHHRSTLGYYVNYEPAELPYHIPKWELEPMPMETKENPLDVQVSGDHYKKLSIQPIEYIHGNGIPFAEGCVIKYVSRWRDKGGIKDLEKARHFIDLLIELEKK